mgnify:CR=1 FL=1
MPKKNQHKNFVSVEVAIHLEQWGKLIAQRRKFIKLTHADLGVRLGVSQPTISRIERGDPAVAVGTYLAAMYALSLQHKTVPLLAELFS